MRRITIAAVLLAVLATPALAQQRSPKDDNPLAVKDEMRKKENAAIDKQYQKTLQQTRGTDAPVKTDPWANLRGTDASKR